MFAMDVKKRRNFQPPLREWRQRTCEKFRLLFQENSAYVTRNSSLSRPIQVAEVKGDGNCLFRALALAITGSEEQYSVIRQLITNLMETLN